MQALFEDGLSWQLKAAMILGVAYVLACDGAVPQLLPRVEGDRDPDEIRQVVQASRDAFRSCYEGALLGDDAPDVSALIHLTISDNGMPEEVRVAPIAGAPGMAPCLMAAAAGLHFPDNGAARTVVHYPLAFSRTPEGPKRRLDHDDVLPVAMGVAPTVRNCGASLQKGTRIIAKFTIEHDGSVSGVSVDQSGDVGACAKAALHTMHFSAYVEGEPVPVTFPFLAGE